jgi:hypothetical protein
MDPFGNKSNSHNDWIVLLSFYNLPPWFCNKRKYMMMPILISGPQQPGINFDVYLRPLVDDMKILWDGVKAYDEYKKKQFTLCGMMMFFLNCGLI